MHPVAIQFAIVLALIVYTNDMDIIVRTYLPTSNLPLRAYSIDLRRD